MSIVARSAVNNVVTAIAVDSVIASTRIDQVVTIVAVDVVVMAVNSFFIISKLKRPFGNGRLLRCANPVQSIGTTCLVNDISGIDGKAALNFPRAMPEFHPLTGQADEFLCSKCYRANR